MFTGIIAAVGKIISIRPLEAGVRLSIDSGLLDTSDVVLGDSIAVNGVCLTVVAQQNKLFEFDVSHETLNCTTGLQIKAEVNLEKALRLADRLGGHLVSGHVDGIGEVVDFSPAGESYTLRVRAPIEIAFYIARKGSICIDGVSLTVNEIDAQHVFTVNIIPHTLQVTTLKHLCKGKQVNLEIDLIARYVSRMLEPQHQS